MLFSYTYAGKPSIDTMKWRRYASISSNRRHFGNEGSKGGSPKGLWIALGSGFSSLAGLLTYMYKRQRAQVWPLDSFFLGFVQMSSKCVLKVNVGRKVRDGSRYGKTTPFSY